MRKLYAYLFLLLTMGGLPACQDCGPSAEVEPQVELVLSRQVSRPFRIGEVVQAMYGLGTPDPQPLAQPTDTTRRYSHTLKLPINLRADQTRYVLAGRVRRDTITINYQRIFTYKDDKCGYLLDVQSPAGFGTDPATPLSVAVITTLGTVQNIYYEGTRPVSNGWAPPTLSDSGIYLSIKLP